MYVNGYGITLRRLRQQDIEMVRNWRNSQAVTPYMEYREYITPEMQQKWFDSIDNVHNDFTIIEHNGEQAGLVYGGQADWDTKVVGNGGIFMKDEHYHHSDVPMRASFLFLDMSYIFGLERIYIKVLSDNKRAIMYNKQLGFRLLPGQDEVYNQRYELITSDYIERNKALKKSLMGGLTKHEMYIDDMTPAAKNIITQYQQGPASRQALLNLTVRSPLG